MPPHDIPGRKKKIGSVGLLKKLEKAQRIAMLMINGGLQTTPTDLLDLHAKVLLMDLMLEKACHRGLVRACTLLDTHPLSDIVKSYHETALDPKVTLQTNLHKLLWLYRINPNTIEKIEPVCTIPERLKAFTTEIVDNRQKSIIQEFLDNADVALYTDGSKIEEGGVGASAILLKKGHALPSSKLCYYIGHESQYMSYEAEAIGLLLGAHLLYREQNSLPDSNIY